MKRAAIIALFIVVLAAIGPRNCNYSDNLIMRRRPARRPGHDETLAGGYQHCAEKHLHRDLSEFDFRYSNRMALGVNDRNAQTLPSRVRLASV